jgi:preprotein translocase subunit Sss1
MKIKHKPNKTSKAKTTQPKKPKTKKLSFEDIIGFGAMLRPYIGEAISRIPQEQLIGFFEWVEKFEKSLSQTHGEKVQVQNLLGQFTEVEHLNSHVRFVGQKVKSFWEECDKPGFKEYSTLTLIVGMMYEESEKRIPSPLFRKISF